MAKFQIKNVSKPFQPVCIDEDYSIEVGKFDLCNEFILNDNYCKVIYSNNAKKTIWKHIGWGIDTVDNQVEQGGVLIGYVEKYQNALIAQVEFAIPGNTEGSIKHLKFTHSTWNEIYDEIDKITNDLTKSRHIVGWYHTHPKHLKVYMSATDKATQMDTFYEPWHISSILNPQQKIWRNYAGKNSDEIVGYIKK